MSRSKLVLVVLAAVIAAACNAGSGDAGAEERPAPTHAERESNLLSLRRTAQGVTIEHAAGRVPPRMTDIRLRWTGGWKLTSHEVGEAASVAEKEVRVVDVSDHEARLIVFSASNTQTIGSGALVELKLEGGSGGTIDIQPTPPMLAPAEAENGLMIGDPISL